MQHGFYFDQTRCIGCDTCTVACKDWNDVPAGPASWIRVNTIENISSRVETIEEKRRQMYEALTTLVKELEYF